MKFRRAKNEAPATVEDFSLWESEIARDYEREYGLGFTPNDIFRSLKRFGWGTRIKRGRPIKDLVPFYSTYDTRIFDFLTHLDSCLSAEQNEAVDHLSRVAGKTMESDDESFGRGFRYYLQLALETDKLPSGFQSDFETLVSVLPRVETGRGLVELERKAQHDAPLVVGSFAEVHNLSTAPIVIKNYWLARAGIGLAYEMCEQLAGSIENEAALSAQD
jgi:hypothetical protein